MNTLKGLVNMIDTTKKTAAALATATAFLFSALLSSAAAGDAVLQEPLTVTAQKIQQDLSDVPISMDVFSDQDISDAGMADLADLVQWTPNVHLRQDSFENTLIIRGISAFHTSLNSPAGIYIDDVSLPLVYMHNLDLLDLARVEILKGPQGTLYGKNSESGVVNLITVKPGEIFSGKAVIGAGNYDTYQAKLMLNGPLVLDKLFAGFAFSHEQSDGFTENLYNGSDDIAGRSRYFGRGSLRFTPSDRLEISLVADVGDFDDTNGVKRWITAYPVTSVGDAAMTPEYQVSHNRTEEPYHQKSNGLALKIDFQGKSFNFLSITGHRAYDLDAGSDQDMTSLISRYSDFTYTNHLFSQELRVSSRDNGRLSWLAGIYGSMDTTEVDMDITMDMGPSTFSMVDNQSEIDSRSLALFGQTIWTPFERFHLTAGLRLDYQEMNGTLGSTAMLMTGGNQDLNFDTDLDYFELLPKLCLSWDATPAAMVYASVARGYLSGGYNYAITGTDASTLPTEDNFTYDPEYTISYELGLKTQRPDRTLTLNTALFYIDIRDKQVSQPIEGLPDASEIVNAPRAYSLGGEMDITYRPARGFTLFGSLGYTYARFKDWVNSDGIDYDGKQLPDGPLYTYSLGASYMTMGGFSCRADILGMGKFYSDPQNTLGQGAYALVNLRMGYDTEHFGVALWVKNFFDTHYYNSMSSLVYSGTTAVFAEDGAPRTFGIDITYRF